MVIDVKQRLETLRANPLANEDGVFANDLLREFHRDQPVVDLRLLLTSSVDAAVRCGVWIASELGVRAQPLLQNVAPLLGHRSADVRFDALDCVLTCASGTDAAILANLPMLLEDSASSVRWKAMSCLARASGEQLIGARRGIELDGGSSEHVDGINLLLGCRDTPADCLLALMKNDASLQRKYAVIAAARRADELVEDQLLETATTSDDEDVGKFALSVLGLMQSRPPINEHRWR